MSSLQRSGKTAPRLVQDIRDYDPAHPPSSGRNLLADIPPVFPGDYHGPREYISPSTCHHDYRLKTSQSFVQQADQKGSSGAPTRVSAFCYKCRYHLEVKVTSNPGIGHSGHLPSDHIHHLVYNSGRHKGGPSPEEITSKGQTAETFNYKCSYFTCPAAVTVRVTSPVFDHQSVQLLTDPELLKTRAEEAVAAYSEHMEGIGAPQPITVLLTLRAYLNNALHDPQQNKSIKATNKRFMTCFGTEGLPCKDLLESLGFSVKDRESWDPPRPSAWAEFPYRDQQKIFLDDVIHELCALIDQRPLMEKKGNQIKDTYTPALESLLGALDAYNYPQSPRSSEFQMASGPYYEDLGVVEDMSSAAIIEAFNRQISVDPARTSLYLQSLRSIGHLRGGDDGSAIDQAVQVAYAEGKYTDDDIASAYEYFGFQHDDAWLTEDTIIGKFYAFLGATTSSQETEVRQQLWRIGDSRRSERIKSAAEDRVATAEQAQVYLGVSSDTPDDFVMTMYTTKVNDNPTSRDLARRAIELIAESRNSEALKHFLKTGETTAGQMDVADAYRLLQIPDRTVDESAIIAAYTICVNEAPAQAETYNQALSLIANDKESPMLRSMISGTADKPDRNMSQWPVGLHNIGNTCYLNSLLQFYYSVQPFRNMVLDFENYRQELGDEEDFSKKVGSRKVSKKEVERSQRFLRELRILFQDMMTSPNSFVTPGRELARLTLISPSNEAAIRRRSTISASQPAAIGEINGLPILGPLGPPQTATADSEPKDLVPLGVERFQRSATSDGDSEATLVADGPKNVAPLAKSDDKENEAPSADTVMTDAQSEPTPKAAEELSPSSQPPAAEQIPALPDQPPPVPPRPTPQLDPQQQLIEEVEIGAQQDVTEVINNVLFQSQCAIRPTSIATDGEQVDLVKDLFYGQTRSYILSGENTRSKEERWCDIKVDVATGSRDIYAAIDGAFDIQNVNVENTVAEQFGAISKLPPVLQIQVQRVQFDPTTKRSFKSTHHLDLKETIYLDRYMDTPAQSEIMQRRQQCWQWKSKLKELEARREQLLRKNVSDGLDLPTLFDTAKEVLEDLSSMKETPESAQDAIDINPELAPELGQLSQIARAELKYIEHEIQNTQTMISSQFVDFKHLAYRLFAVFVHSGTVSFGHYYIYIYDFKQDIWRKYNDEYVTEVQNLDEIFKSQDRQNPPTPYFLVYVNDTMKDRLASPVCREMVDTPPNASHQPDSHAMEGVTTTGGTPPAPTEDTDMNPPPYNAAWADKGASGTADDTHMGDPETKTVNAESSWTNSGWQSSDTNGPRAQW